MKKSEKYCELTEALTRNVEKLEEIKKKWTEKGLSKDSEEYKEMMELLSRGENISRELNSLIEDSTEEEVEKMVSDYEKIKKSLD